MKVMELANGWGTKHIKPTTRPDPVAGAGEVVITMQALSVNPRDNVVISGGYGRHAALPLIPLCDGAGIISDIGAGVTGFAIGDLVCPTYSRTWPQGIVTQSAFAGALGMALDGTAQEYFLSPAEAIIHAPKHYNAQEAATLPCTGVTAWNAIVEQGKIRADDRILIQGTGSVSLFALQFAKMHGAEVIITSSSDEKLERAKAMGADHLINYRETPNWDKKTREITDGYGVDNIIEVGGGGTLSKSIACVTPGGTISVIGILDGIAGEINLGPIVTRNIRLQGVTCGGGDMFKNMVNALNHHKTRPIIDHKGYSFDDIGAALDALPLNKHFGKIICSF
jgi:NADPH:quinone reductase-like Zn-dependent oxidoreductase